MGLFDFEKYKRDFSVQTIKNYLKLLENGCKHTRDSKECEEKIKMIIRKKMEGLMNDD